MRIKPFDYVVAEKLVVEKNMYNYAKECQKQALNFLGKN